MITYDDLTAMGYYDANEGRPIKDTPDTPADYVEEYYRVVGKEPDVDMAFTLVEEEFKELIETAPRRVEDLKELADLVYVCYGYALACGYDLDEAVKRVHENNLGRMFQEDGSIQRRYDGKVIKNPTYPKVDLGDLV